MCPLEKPVVTSTSSPVKKDHSFAQRSSMRPRYLGKMKSPTNLDFFKRYLRAYDAHGALNFYHEVDKLRHIDSLLQKTKINSIVSRFLRRADASNHTE